MGSSPRAVQEDVREADWSPDGSDLAMVRRVEGRDPFEFPVGKVLFQPAEGEGTDPAGIMVLVSFRVTPDGRSRAYTWHRALSNL